MFIVTKCSQQLFNSKLQLLSLSLSFLQTTWRVTLWHNCLILAHTASQYSHIHLSTQNGNEGNALAACLTLSQIQARHVQSFMFKTLHGLSGECQLVSDNIRRLQLSDTFTCCAVDQYSSLWQVSQCCWSLQ